MPPVAAAVSPVRKSRVEKHGRELAVGGSGGRPGNTQSVREISSASSTIILLLNGG